MEAFKTSLTPDELDAIRAEIESYLEICPLMAKAHAAENMDGFITGWICRAAFEKEIRYLETEKDHKQ